MTTRTLMAVVLCWIPLAAIADPNFENQDLFTSGDGLIMVDHSTGLAWLKVTATKGYSIEEVLANAGGFMTAGFRYASRGELTLMLQEAGFHFQAGGDWTSTTGFAPQLSAMLGGINTDVAQELLEGFTTPIPCQGGDCDQAPLFSYPFRLHTFPPGQELGGLYDGISPIPSGRLGSRYHNPWIGSWLVRLHSSCALGGCASEQPRNSRSR